MGRRMTRRVTFWIGEDRFDLLRQQAYRNGVSVSDLVRYLIYCYLEGVDSPLSIKKDVAFVK